MALSMTGQQITPESIKEAECELDEAMKRLFELISRPGVLKVWTRLDCLEYIPVRRDDGSVDFMLDQEQAVRKAWLDAILGPANPRDAAE